MKILAFVDLHGNYKALERITEKSKKADIIVCAGDISIFENNLDRLLFQLNKLKKTILIIPGNHESDEDLNKLSEIFDNIINIHKKSFVKEGYLFLGYGGGGFSMIDKDFDKVGKRFEKRIKKIKDNKETKKIILVTHAPPYKTKIDMVAGEAYGNKNIKGFILKVKPELVISGHLHENAGKECKIGKTTLINPGPYGKLITI